MTFDIVAIVEKISVFSPHVTPDWPSFVAWIASQLPRRTIVGFISWDSKLRGWKDPWSAGGEQSGETTASFHGAVLSSELVNFLQGPPLNLAEDTAVAVREHLIGTGLLAAHRFHKGQPCNAILQFRR